MGQKGKYFLIVSKLNGKVFDIRGAALNGDVILWDKHGRDNQVWFQEPITGTIRSKLNPEFCLDINGANRLYVNHYQPGDRNQQWFYNKRREVIENRADPNRVLDVANNSRDQGAGVCAWNFHGHDNQQFKLEYLPSRYFFIKSNLNGKVLDVEGGRGRPGARVIVWHQKEGRADNQLWFEDRFGNIRSKLDDDLVLDARNGGLHLSKFEEGQSRLYWALHGNRIVNVHNHNEVLDIKGNNRDDGAEVVAWQSHGGANQQWHFEYV